jgi:hypothetical protein
VLPHEDKNLKLHLARRLIAVLVGGPLLLVTIVEAYLQNFGFYLDHFVIPKLKYGSPTLLRWQDVAWLALFWPIAILLFYVSFRLLKYAFRRELPSG